MSREEHILADTTEARPFVRPGLFVVLLALFCAACETRTTTPSLAAGAGLPTAPDTGVVLFRVEYVGRDGYPRTDTRLPLSVAWTGANHETFEIVAAEEGTNAAADFYASLPVGAYTRLVDVPRYASTPYSVVRIVVQPGELAYVGTLRHHQGAGMSATVTLHDDYDAVVARFRARNPAVTAPVKKSLFEKLTCDPDCKPEPWSP